MELVTSFLDLELLDSLKWPLTSFSAPSDESSKQPLCSLKRLSVGGGLAFRVPSTTIGTNNWPMIILIYGATQIN